MVQDFVRTLKINEDVIATSGEFCSNHTPHFIFTSWGIDGNPGCPQGQEGNDIGLLYVFEQGKWYCTEITNGDATQNFQNPQLNVYYYYQQSAQCNGSHNPSDATRLTR